MNLLTIIILLVLLVFAINGYMRGFARTLTSLLFFVFSGVLVYYSTPYVNDFLKTQTPVYSFVESKCETLVEDAIMDKLDKETQKFAQQSDVPRKDQNKIIKSLQIPFTNPSAPPHIRLTPRRIGNLVMIRSARATACRAILTRLKEIK